MAFVAFIYFSVQLIAHLSSLFRTWNNYYYIIIAIQFVGMSTITSFVPKSQTQTLKQSSDIWL